MYLLVLLPICLFSQNAEVKLMLKEIEDQWSVDDNGNITYQAVIEVPGMTKEDIYNRSLAFFIYNYSSGKSVIQTQEKENGLLIGKGLYTNVHVGVTIVNTYIDTWHILRVDIKEGRARILLTLTEYEKKVTGGNTPPSYFSIKISEEYPVNPKGMFKTVNGKGFYYSHKRALNTLERIEIAIKEGTTSKEFEDADW